MSTHLDGNALAGPLAEIFAVEVTACGCRCGACGAAGPIGAAPAYLRGPGAVLRCASCAAVLLVLTETPAGHRLRLGDGVSLIVPELDT
ncbi:DUF6510 family protein [Nocardia asteroides]|uniref:DUF6510 family protein n=1 Tax=Nocardia asteroides TaxID=1824 RepID=UPI001E510AB2|nr:DUF6510 family protein [Nocardia asteroides]UGT62886.1 DUF6510 family protein [Nocardia asteroides]